MVQSIYQQELRDRQALAEERRNQQERDDVARVVGGLGGVVITPQTAIAEERERDNTLALIAGIHGGATITKPNTTIIGHPGAITNRLWTINTVNQVTRIQGVHFRCLDPQANNAVALVNIMAVSTVLFTACTFELGGITMVAMVAMEATAKAIFSDCIFAGTQTAGNPVANAGAIGNAYIMGCSNKTTRIHMNTTIISEVQ